MLWEENKMIEITATQKGITIEYKNNKKTFKKHNTLCNIIYCVSKFFFKKIWR